MNIYGRKITLILIPTSNACPILYLAFLSLLLMYVTASINFVMFPGMNGLVRYSLSDNYFRVDSTDGTVTVTHQLDYERSKRHQLTVTATDAGTPALSSFATIIIQGT